MICAPVSALTSSGLAAGALHGSDRDRAASRRTHGLYADDLRRPWAPTKGSGVPAGYNTRANVPGVLRQSLQNVVKAQTRLS